MKANYLASPPLVVAYALAGGVDIDLQNEPLGKASDGQPVYLRDIWPSNEEVRAASREFVREEMFSRQYSEVFAGDPQWNAIRVPAGARYAWDGASTYIQKPPYFDQLADPSQPLADMTDMRVLAVLGDSVTTDHISPAGSIAVDGPAGKYLISLGVQPKDFNSYGARRGNHEVMVRGTLANIRLRNQLAPGTEGGWTVHVPSGEQMSIYDASMRYQQEGVGLMIVAGKEYGSGSSRDWAAKGVALLGVRAVIAESFERIHRSNLVGMGVLPLEFLPGQNRETLGLTGKESYSVTGVQKAVGGTRRATVAAVSGEGARKEFEVVVRVDTPREADYYRFGGILPYVLNQIVRGSNGV